jgi:hypothetical protein
MGRVRTLVDGLVGHVWIFRRSKDGSVAESTALKMPEAENVDNSQNQIRGEGGILVRNQV